MADIKDITINTGKQDHVLFQDVCSIIEHGRQQAYGSVSQIAIATYLDYYKKFYLLFPDPQKVNTCVHNLEKFILELGRGFAFVERQQHA